MVNTIYMIKQSLPIKSNSFTSNTKHTGRMTETITRRAVQQHRGSLSWNRRASTSKVVCKFWLAGNCTKNPCRFAHTDVTAPVNRVLRLNRSSFRESHDQKKESEECKIKKNEVKECDHHEESASADATTGDVEKSQYCTKICEHWMKNSCVHGKDCKFLHSWCYGDGITMVAQLQGHKKAVTGITLPENSDKLFSGSKDGTVRVWNCHTGECIGVADVGSPVESLISEGPWVLAGLVNSVKVWNIQSNAEFTLSTSAGQVYTMVAANGMLFAGAQDGSILVWKFNAEASSFDSISPLKGHIGAVVSLIYGANRLYSGSMDNTIRVWDLETMQCIHTLAKHSEVVMSVLCWERYLISSSLDRTLKVWAATEAGELEVTYEHNEEHGILSLRGMHDAANKPIMLCSSNDNTVRLYELPSFVERGRIFSKQEVRGIHVGPAGLFFTGDGTGLVSVWRCSSDSTASSDKAA
ncbi:zinc finger CCCH domain-containing protein 48 [Beta vulgaris subsp. vulgaris]|uniref:zinc finger CCCH domain-containing protein 48 n=1 Tax=Beta vulgaris subsp. vulgaris TaxID=3555 RepID=UPI0020371A87|nr:zinc finger CCCH domain-containing protein 48 [Beta vulgaris subsp. vulgaris]